MYTSTCIMSALLKNTAQYPLTNEFRGLYAKKDSLTPKPHYSSDLHLQWVLLGRKSSEKTTEGVFCYWCRTKTLQRVEPLCPNLCGFKQPELPSVLTIKGWTWNWFTFAHAAAWFSLWLQTQIVLRYCCASRDKICSDWNGHERRTHPVRIRQNAQL